MSRLNEKLLSKLLLRLFARFVEKITPHHGGNATANYLLDDLWREHPSVLRVLPRLLPELGIAICLRSIKRFCLRMASAQLCVFIWFWFFADQHRFRMIPLLGLTFLGLLVREAYVIPTERLWCELVTGLLTMPLVVFLDAALGWISPDLMTPIETLAPMLGPVCVVIALFRYHLAPEVGPEHPYKDVLRRHHLTWYWNDLWLALWVAYLLTVELGAPFKWFFEAWLTITPAILLFSAGIRLQLNPISGNYRHRMIGVQLLTDPYQDDVRMKRDYLLVGADWFRNFKLQSLLEILSFVFALMPLVIAAVQWYTSDPIAANFHGFRIALSAGAYVLLLGSWPYVKKLNRRTCRVFDQTIQTFSGGPKNNCKDLGTSNVMYCERSDMATSDKNEAFQQRFDGLFRQNRQMLYHVAYRNTGNHHDAEEALQNGFLKVMEVFSRPNDQRGRAEVIRNPIGYLRQAVTNAALDLLRRQKRTGRRHLSHTECERIPAPETIADLDERIPYLREALAKMKPKLVQILNLCLVDKKSCAEVAKKLGMPVGTVYGNLWRAKHQVKRMIRIEEKRYEAQKNQHRGIPKPGLADASGA